MFLKDEGFFRGFDWMVRLIVRGSKGGSLPPSAFLEPSVNMGLGIGLGLLCILVCAVAHFYGMHVSEHDPSYDPWFCVDKNNPAADDYYHLFSFIFGAVVVVLGGAYFKVGVGMVGWFSCREVCWLFGVIFSLSGAALVGTAAVGSNYKVTQKFGKRWRS